MGARLEAVDALLRRDLGAGVDGPLTFTPPVTRQAAALMEVNTMLGRKAEDARVEAEKAIAKAKEESTAEVQLREAALAVEKDRAAKQEDELRRELERERHAHAAEAAALAEAQRLREEESISASLRVSQAEVRAAAERTRAEQAQAELQAERVKPLPAGRSVPQIRPAQPVKMLANYDAAGLMLGFTLETATQKLFARIARDGAGDPIAFDIEPGG